MKELTICTALLLGILSVNADDIADAKSAFERFVEYQRTDDLRILGLISRECAVTMTVTDGKASRDHEVPAHVFRSKLVMIIAEKQGNGDTYEEVTFVREGLSVRSKATVLHAQVNKRGPFSALFTRDKDGLFQISELKVTIFSDKLPDK